MLGHLFFILESSPGHALHTIGSREWRWIRKGVEGFLQVHIPALVDYTLPISYRRKRLVVSVSNWFGGLRTNRFR